MQEYISKTFDVAYEIVNYYPVIQDKMYSSWSNSFLDKGVKKMAKEVLYSVFRHKFLKRREYFQEFRNVFLNLSKPVSNLSNGARDYDFLFS